MAKIKGQGSGGPKVSSLGVKTGRKKKSKNPTGKTGDIGAPFSYVLTGMEPGVPDVRFADDEK